LGWQLEKGFMRRYTAAWNCTKFLQALRSLSRGKPRGIKPDFRITPDVQTFMTIEPDVATGGCGAFTPYDISIYSLNPFN
jgi:hypothetical protein